MTSADLVNLIFEGTGCSRKDAAEVIEELLEVMKATLEAEGEVKISGFGKFAVKRKGVRRGRNPQTSGTHHGRRVLTFKPSPILKNRLNA